MARRDALDLQILGCVTCKFENFGCEVFKDSGEVDGRLRANTSLLARNGAKVTLYATARELLQR
jgi:hypothetical protein